MTELYLDAGIATAVGISFCFYTHWTQIREVLKCTLWVQ